jgi:hypothetical protein
MRGKTLLLAAGAENIHFSYYEKVLGQDAPGIEYLGHFSWIYVLLKVDGADTTMWGWLAAQKK